MRRAKPLRRVPFKRKPKKPKPTLGDMVASGEVVKASKLKPRKPMKKRAANNTGWIDVAREIWDEPSNDHKCEVCEAPLGDVFNRIFYHHILHRGTYKRFKRRKDNLAQVCPDCHGKAHDYGVEGMADDGDENPGGWMRLEFRQRTLRNEAHGLTKNT